MGEAAPPTGALNPRFYAVFTYGSSVVTKELGYDPISKKIGLSSGGSIVPFGFKAPGRGNNIIYLKMKYKIGSYNNPDSETLGTAVVINVS